MTPSQRDEDSCFAPPQPNNTESVSFEPTFPDKIEFLGFGEGKSSSAACAFKHLFCFSVFFDNVRLRWLRELPNLPSRHEEQI